MVGKWEKVKRALGIKLCYYAPIAAAEGDAGDGDGDYSQLPSMSSERLSDAALLARPAVAGGWNGLQRSASTAATVADVGSSQLVAKARFRLTKSFNKSRSSEKTCSLCLTTMNPGEGRAIFVAECLHAFHYGCITSNGKHKNQICPVCMTRWKQVPGKFPKPDPGAERSSRGHVRQPTQNDNAMTVIRRLPSPRNSSRHVMPLFQETEPALFDDDETMGETEICLGAASRPEDNSSKILDIRMYPEVTAVPQTKTGSDFAVLINLKATATSSLQSSSANAGLPSVSQTSRAPVDLVTVIDISGSMAGTKLALLKRAMGFVIQNMSSSDRLSVIAFSSTARRLFPLCRMSEAGRQKALLAVNSLSANGGTNIAEGLRKGAKVLEERREMSPVASIILLSDGQDTYTVKGSGSSKKQPNYQLLLPLSIKGCKGSGFKIPVHTFGFGADHDASSMHSISETSGGTFSFIETEAAIQDAFAQCIGGLLSVVVQELIVDIDCVHPSVRLQSVKAGSYPYQIIRNGQSGKIDVGDMYADEERDFLVLLNIPEEYSGNQTALLKVKCLFKDHVTKQFLTNEGSEVVIHRPEHLTGEEMPSIEVDRQWNRLRAAEAISQARAAAEHGDLGDAISILENCRQTLSESISARCQDRLCIALDAELKEMQERMTSRHVYEASGRAYVLSGLSSHSWQRATARGDSTDNSSLIQSYQTPSMTEMLTRSQATLVSSPGSRRLARPLWPFNPPKPR